MKKILLIFAILTPIFLVFSQDYIPENKSVKTNRSTQYAFTNAIIHVSPTQIIENGTLLIEDNKIVSAAATVTIPDNCIVTDLKGKHIYPSFIDLYSSFGISTPKTSSNHSRNPQYDANREGYYWNDHIRPDINAIDAFKFDDKSAKELQKLGFGVVNTHMNDGIIRGTGTLIALQTSSNDAHRILETQLAQYLGTKKSKLSKQKYPSSLMGTFALLRQVNYDAEWYSKGGIKQKDRALEAFLANKSEIQIIEAGNKLNALRLDAIGDEFNTQYIIVGGGDEYEYIKDIKATQATFIIPLNFPEAFDMENPLLAKQAELEDLREWNQRPYNPKILAENNVPFAFSLYKLKDKKQFIPNLLKAVKLGLSKEEALAALTTIPAKIIEKNDVLGTLKSGAYANFLITSGDFFESNTKLYQNWVLGHKNEVTPIPDNIIIGDYTFNLGTTNYSLSISEKGNKLNAIVKNDSIKRDAKISYKDQWLLVTFPNIDSTKQNLTRLISKITNATNTLNGKAYLFDGTETNFSATKNSLSKEKPKNKKKDSRISHSFLPITYPNRAYGFSSLPKQETVLFKNATVWTNEKEGVLKQTDVLIKNGKIAKIGTSLTDKNAIVIDATGKHLTSGIIDEHSHIATSSVNESGQNSSAEVSIEDVINPEDINIYRNLAGGVTSIQILHGSANPIGGRSAIIKLKWGETAKHLLYENAPKFIKFALGENVKQSNWGDYSKIRFPQTRMGVEQLYIDYFQRAKEYNILKKNGKPYRKDLELETLSEILNKERFISCHSYIQSEINMLMKVADQFQFNINTFTHILEGYKVADKMLKHGVGASTFSDWWAYKYEVNDAIPFNAAIMHNAGLTVAINSDDAEMSRRLNQEAAKTIKYGNVSEEDAWKFVTLNPAKLLHIDDRVGSIKIGKDADIVLWSDNPLSVYAKAEKTMIEGVTYFDIKRDKKQREAIKKEKNELISLMLQAKNKGLKTQPIKQKAAKHFHCDTNI